MTSRIAPAPVFATILRSICEFNAPYSAVIATSLVRLAPRDLQEMRPIIVLFNGSAHGASRKIARQGAAIDLH
jgi:hypothetical protein